MKSIDVFFIFEKNKSSNLIKIEEDKIFSQYIISTTLEVLSFKNER